MKRVVLFFLLALLGSAAVAKDSKDVDRAIKKVRIGMTMKKVISLVGDSYTLLSAKEGVTVWGYTAADKGVYTLVFVADKLKELRKDYYRGWFPILPSAYVGNADTVPRLQRRGFRH
ncbi:hypothetical protein ACL9RF_06100 [Sphingobacterium sp. Mn56C]|uniref:hypothetical protein n=1 Tax=Sphingobacterium sp. Mn56C TaxID=3395261 RepID=UPI003BBBCE38